MYRCFFLVLAELTTTFVYSQSKADDQEIRSTIEVRVDGLISQMTIEEKVSQLFNASPAIDRLGIPSYNWWNECLHGVARAGKGTVFPQAIGLASTFDESLMYRLGNAISDEARAKHHYFIRHNARDIYMGLTFWTPNINIFRDPRWGRGQETYGEDPHLTSRIAVNFIRGLQGSDPTYLKTIATAKHYAVHSGPEISRHVENVFVHNHDLYTTYLPAFEAVVREANVQSVMCAYNRFRDRPCCGSDLLLNDILRNKFDFKGYVVSDCGAITDFYKKDNHHIVETPSQALGWSLASGTDLNCEEDKAFIEDNLRHALETGKVNEKDINTALRRLFTARFRLGMFDADSLVPYSRIPMSVVGSSKHQRLNLEAAEKSLVLLKNNGILPLREDVTVAMVGPNANHLSVLLGNYNGEPIDPVTPLKALKERIGRKLRYAVGGPIIEGQFTNYSSIAPSFLFHLQDGQLKKGLVGNYFDDAEFKHKRFSRIDPQINFSWDASPVEGVVNRPFSIEWTGVLIPKTTGNYSLGGNVDVEIDGVKISRKSIALEKGKRYSLRIRHIAKSTAWSNSYQQQIASLTWVNTSIDYKTEAIKIAAGADVVIFCGGISPDLEGEEMNLTVDGFSHGDRVHINLPKTQEDLIKELYLVNKNIIFINFSGSAIALNWEKENLPAIVQAFYPGEKAGLALSRLLFGDFSPSGKLPITFYRSVDDLPAFQDYSMKGRTYRYYSGQPLFPFGHGLSYTRFHYDSIDAPVELTTGRPFDIKVQVANIGNVPSDEVVQLYLSREGAPERRSLVFFQRIFLKPGERKILTATIPVDKLSSLNSDMHRVCEPGKFFLSVGGGQPDASSQSGDWVAKGINVRGSIVSLE